MMQKATKTKGIFILLISRIHFYDLDLQLKYFIKLNILTNKTDKTLGPKAIRKIKLHLHAFVLMDNYY